MREATAWTSPAAAREPWSYELRSMTQSGSRASTRRRKALGWPAPTASGRASRLRRWCPHWVPSCVRCAFQWDRRSPPQLAGAEACHLGSRCGRRRRQQPRARQGTLTHGGSGRSAGPLVTSVTRELAVPAGPLPPQRCWQTASAWPPCSAAAAAAALQAVQVGQGARAATSQQGLCWRGAQHTRSLWHPSTW